MEAVSPVSFEPRMTTDDMDRHGWFSWFSEGNAAVALKQDGSLPKRS